MEVIGSVVVPFIIFKNNELYSRCCAVILDYSVLVSRVD